jgi:hypothetical protein
MVENWQKFQTTFFHYWRVGEGVMETTSVNKMISKWGIMEATLW